MPRPRGIPRYGLHKASGQARSIVGGSNVYLGAYRLAEKPRTVCSVIAERLQQGHGTHHYPPPVHSQALRF